MNVGDKISVSELYVFNWTRKFLYDAHLDESQSALLKISSET